MISELDNTSSEMADQIFTVFQRSYKIEADLIGCDCFPPLFRTTQQIARADTRFFGIIEEHCAAAVVEIEITPHCLEIHSLTVDPSYFKRGFASKLISYILTSFDISRALVETAVVNSPAIALYKKHGFVEYKQWTPPHGIEKIAMSLDLPS